MNEGPDSAGHMSALNVDTWVLLPRSAVGSRPVADIRFIDRTQLMRAALILAIALLVAAAGPSATPLSNRDFQQLMKAAVAAASAPSEVQPHTTTICVARELQPAFGATKGWLATWEAAGERAPRPRTGNIGADNSMTAAMSPKAAVAQTAMPALPRQYLLGTSKALPPECIISHALTRGPNWERDESIVVLTFTRPAQANGYAYIEEHEECPGLCGTTFLRVFRKQNGKWAQVAKTILSVS